MVSQAADGGVTRPVSGAGQMQVRAIRVKLPSRDRLACMPVPLAMPVAQDVVIVIFIGIVALMGIAIVAVLRRGGRQ